MSSQELPLCECNSKSSFYCGNEEKYLCSQHLKNNHLDHSISYYSGVLKDRVKNSILQGLIKIRNKAENSLLLLNSRIESLYNEINAAYLKAQGEIANNLEIINCMIEDFDKSNNFIRVYPIILAIEENEERALKDLEHRFDFKISDKIILQEIPKFLCVYSTCSEIFSFEKEQKLINADIAIKNAEFYQLFKEAHTNYSSDDPDDNLMAWIRSIECKRNCENFKTIHIRGSSITELQIQCYNYLTRAYSIKELLLDDFVETDLEKLIDTTISNLQTLECLEIDRCEVTNTSCEKLCNSLANCNNLKEIIINECQTGEYIVKIIEKSDLSGLITLALSSTLISDSGVAKLCQFFPQLHRIKYLYLNSNFISEQGGLELRVYLKYLLTLIEINLSSNNIGNVAGEIFEALSSLPLISSIDISSIEFNQSQEPLLLENAQKLIYLDTIVFDMTMSENFLEILKPKLPEFCHIYRYNPDQFVKIEFK